MLLYPPARPISAARLAGADQRHARSQRRLLSRACSSLAAATVAASVLGVVVSPTASAEDAVTVGKRYNDRLDSRWSAVRFASASRDAGYSATAYQNGRSANDAWSDMYSSSVVGYFGHGNAGIFQLNEGATDAEDPVLAAGQETQIVSTFANLRFWSEFLPFAEIDDLKLAIMAACYTANTDPGFGQFADIGARKGIDAVVGFTDLVYYPASVAGTAASDTNYSGNYFWSRFSVYMKAGNTVAQALSKARTDLVAKEGNAGGWNKYRIGGSAATPGTTRLTPAGSGAAGTSQPGGIDPYSISQLTMVASLEVNGPLSDMVEFTTQEQVTYRTAGGRLFDIHAPASTQADAHAEPLSLAAAEREARVFAIEHGMPVDRWETMQVGEVSHAPGELLAAITFRPVSAEGVPLAREVNVEVDRRTGAVTYLGDTRPVLPATQLGSITRQDAIAQASEALLSQGVEVGSDAAVSAQRDLWDRDRWTVTFDSTAVESRAENLEMAPSIKQVVIDATTGQVIAHRTT